MVKELSPPMENNTSCDDGNPQGCMMEALPHANLTETEIVDKVKDGHDTRMVRIIMGTLGDGPSLDAEIETRGRHPTLGLTFSHNTDDTLILIKCNPGTPSARIPKWRQNLRYAKCRQIN